MSPHRVGVRVGDLVGLDGSFVGLFVGLFTFSVGENVGHCSNLRGTSFWPSFGEMMEFSSVRRRVSKDVL